MKPFQWSLDLMWCSWVWWFFEVTLLKPLSWNLRMEWNLYFCSMKVFKDQSIFYKPRVWSFMFSFCILHVPQTTSVKWPCLNIELRCCLLRSEWINWIIILDNVIACHNYFLSDWVLPCRIIKYHNLSKLRQDMVMCALARMRNPLYVRCYWLVYRFF